MKYTTINIQGNLISEEILQKVESGEAQGQKVTDFGFEPIANIRSEIEYAWSRIKLDWKQFSDKSQNLPASDPYGTTLSRKWMEQFLSSIGFDLSKTKLGLQGDNSQSYTISHVAENLSQLPVHIVGFIEPNNPDKNTLDVKSSGGTSRFSPHATMQEYLNVTEHVYGIAANGLFLRLIRDSGRLIKLTYVEFDLKRMLDEDKYSEFTLLYRLLHATRFPRTQSEADQCFLEKYYQDSIETGNRIRDGLSLAVKESLLALGNGFLQHESNAALREKIQNGQLSSKDYYRQLLRIIYRFLFLMVTEERDLVYNPDDKTEETQRLKKVYLQFYSIARLRKLCENRYVYESQFNDLWQGLVQTFQLFEAGGNGKKLGIQPLDGDLFSYNAIQDLQECLISNKLLLECVRNMNEFRDEKKNLVNINYRSLDVEELGSVYEGLLELHPVIENIEASNSAHINFTFHEGTDRKTTGSYYTRPELVNELIKSALIPVIEDRLKEHTGHKEAQAKALLKLKVCDAAAGSGHMLLAAARTIAWYLARVQSGEENPAPSVYRSCLREVIQHCIYAVDFNPDAVELCKLALWLEGHNSGKPLSFLDHKIRNGNSLVGVSDLSVLQKGIPDDAFNPVTGDDKKVSQELKKENAKYNRTKQGTLDFDQIGSIDTASITGDYKELENIRQDNIEGVKQVKTKFDKLRSNNTWFNDWRACNLWTAAFFWNYTEENKQAAPNSERLAKFLQNPAAAYGPMIGKADALSIEHKFFHWPLEFPDVFEQGGFDVMLGNPPWEKVELLQREWFSTIKPDFTTFPAGKEKESFLQELKSKDPEIYNRFILATSSVDKERNFIQSSNRYPLCGQGRINTYSAFAETNLNLLNNKGLAGCVLPPGIATDDSTKFFIQNLLEHNTLRSFFSFTNRGYLFPSIESTLSFALVTYGFIKSVGIKFSGQIWKVEHLNQSGRVYSLTSKEIKSINPNTLNLPIFQNEKDAVIVKRMHLNVPVLENENDVETEKKVFFKQGLFNMTSDKNYFKSLEQLESNNYRLIHNLFVGEDKTYLPLYEAKLTSQYNHRHGSFENVPVSNRFGIRAQTNKPTIDNLRNSTWPIIPRYWVMNEAIYNSKPNEWKFKWFLGFRNAISSVADSRSVSFTIIPYSGVGNSMPLLFVSEAISSALVLANFNSIILDYITRQKASGGNLNFYVVKQLPVIPIETYLNGFLKSVLNAVFELVYNSWDIKAFADDVWKEADADLRAAIQQQWEANQAATGGHAWAPPEWCEVDPEGCPLPPFKWNEERRASLKAELDAIYAKLYGLTTEELRYILDPQDVYGPDFPGETFRVLKEKEIKQFGEYRTRRLVLEAWENLNKDILS